MKFLLGIILFLIISWGALSFFGSFFNTDVVGMSIKAAEENNPSLCNKMNAGPFSMESTSSYINECFYRLAVYTQNKTICGYISDDADASKQQCYKTSISGIDPILCQKFESFYFSWGGDKWQACMDGLREKWKRLYGSN